MPGQGHSLSGAAGRQDDGHVEGDVVHQGEHRGQHQVMQGHQHRLQDEVREGFNDATDDCLENVSNDDKYQN